MPRFELGNTIGKAGKPKGVRNKVASEFFTVLLKIMNEPVYVEELAQTKIEESLRRMYNDKPIEFVKMIVNTLPTEIAFETPISDMSDEELAAALETVRHAVRARAN